MIDLYFSPTPNGMKLKLFLAETGLAHRVVPVSLSGGEQHRPEFLAMSPNGRIPALVDHAPADGGPPLAMFESGAMLLYLARKHGVLPPPARRADQPHTYIHTYEHQQVSLRLIYLTKYNELVTFRVLMRYFVRQ